MGEGQARQPAVAAFALPIVASSNGGETGRGPTASEIKPSSLSHISLMRVGQRVLSAVVPCVGWLRLLAAACRRARMEACYL